MSSSPQRLGLSAQWPRFWRDYGVDRSGGSAAEFALVLPVLSLLLFAIVQFGIVFNHYIELASGVAAASRELSVGRGSTTAYTNTITALNNAAPNLNSFSSPVTGQSFTVTVAGTACTSANQASTCHDAFAQGASAVVNATYPCNLNLIWLNLGSCTLSTSATQYIQ